jgi:hypothetical protein
MTNGHPGAGGPYEREGDDRAGRAGPAPPRDVWGAPQRPARPPQPTAPHPGQQPWGPELGRGRLDPAGPGPAARRPVPQPPPGHPGPVPARHPSWQPNGYQGGHQGGHPNGAPAGPGNGGAYRPPPAPPAGYQAGQVPWPVQGASWPGSAPPSGQVGAAVSDRYPPVGGFTGPDDPGARHRGWQQDAGADVWARPASAEAPHGWQGGNPAEPWRQGLEDPFSTQPGMSRAVRQRVAATGGARVRRVWPQRLVLALVIVAAAIVCWYWLFPILETALPSEF